MWAVRDIRYGGLYQRYKSKKGRLVRLIDPFTAQPVEFSTTLRADNWLLRNFCPGAVQCVVKPDNFGFLENGVTHWAKIDTVTTFKDGIRIADLVTSAVTPPSSESWQILQKAAVIHRLSARLRTRDEIRANPILLANLDMMCQHLVLNADRDRRIDLIQKMLHSYVAEHRQPLSPTDLVKDPRNWRFSQETTDSAIFRLYREGILSVNIAEVPYGSDSCIFLA